MRANRKEKILLLLTAAILLALGIFAACNWADFLHLFKEMVSGVEIVRESILDMGVAGVLIISLIIIVCFFFPVISSIRSIAFGLELLRLSSTTTS